MSKKGKWREVTKGLKRIEEVDDEDRGKREQARLLTPLILNSPADATYDELDTELDLDEMSDKMDEIVTNITNMCAGNHSAANLTKAFREVRRLENFVKEQEKKMKILKIAYTMVMARQFEEEDISSVNLIDGGQAIIWPEPYAVVTDKQKFHEWAHKNGLGPLFSIQWNVLNKEVKDRLEEGLPLPDGVDIYAVDKVQFRKGNSED